MSTAEIQPIANLCYTPTPFDIDEKRAIGDAALTAVECHVLANGMTVLLKEVHHAPVCCWWLLYRVGSRDEPAGMTGAAHWVEHMMFRGTERFPMGVLDAAIDRLGGVWNAQTAQDYTAYYTTLPTAEIGLALEVEADRMRNLLFKAEDFEAERRIILSERQSAANDPLFALDERLNHCAFREHGYRHDALGEEEDLRRLDRATLYDFYQQHYRPANAIAVAAGAFDSVAMLSQIRALYEALPATEALPPPVRIEAPQTSERRFQLRHEGENAFIEIAYRAPPVTHPDWFPLAVLAGILAGASGPGSGNIDNRTSRLYRRLVKGGLAVAVDGNLSPRRDPYLYHLTLTLQHGQEAAEVELAALAELERLRQGELSEREIERAKKQARALFAYSTEGVTGQAFWLAFAENFDSHRWFEEYVERLSAVTTEEIREVARRYLRPEQRIVGWLQPRAQSHPALS